VYADNPQSYRNSFSLFDHKRGTGESIWDIKRRIGYISPEMHLYFNDAADMITVVASGFFDNVGCFRRPNDEQKAIAMQWLKGFGIEHLASRRFPTLSSGEQRLALIARTLLKNAPLLILDEPLHGLDITTKALVSQAIEFIANRQGQTLIYVTHYDNEIPTCVTQIKRLKREQ
jgi:molybdate transport system ATP-binding protein